VLWRCLGAKNHSFSRLNCNELYRIQVESFVISLLLLFRRMASTSQESCSCDKSDVSNTRLLYVIRDNCII
jgi:hypothetical protein